MVFLRDSGEEFSEGFCREVLKDSGRDKEERERGGKG